MTKGVEDNHLRRKKPLKSSLRHTTILYFTPLYNARTEVSLWQSMAMAPMLLFCVVLILFIP